MPEILETVMLVCFGLSWPMNVRKSWRARTAKAMSLGFLILVNVGYVAGIAVAFAALGAGVIAVTRRRDRRVQDLAVVGDGS